MKNKTILLLPMILFLTSCASYSIIPQNITRYDKGVEILTSTQPNSKVQLEISQNKLGGMSNPPFVIYIGVQILKGDNILFDTNNLSASQNGNNLHILSYREILKSSYDFTNILQDFGIPTPASSTNSTIIMPMFYYARGGFLAYNMLFSPFVFNDLQAQQIMQDQRQALKIMATNYLRKTTLSVEGKAKGGFIAINPKEIQTGLLQLKVSLANETHVFNIDIEKIK